MTIIIEDCWVKAQVQQRKQHREFDTIQSKCLPLEASVL